MVHDVAALVTAGGQGSRIREMGVEKPLLPVLGRRLIDRAIQAASSTAYIRTTYVSVSKFTPDTEAYLQGRPVQVMRTKGEGYVPDLHEMMHAIKERSVLICPVDMPLLTGEGIGRLIEEYLRRGEASLTVALPPALVSSLGLDVTYSEVVDGRELTFCGVSVVEREAMLRDFYVAGGYYVTDDEDFAVNVNSKRDLAIAESILRRRGEGV
jgi:adenosylcobinamide-phosphate guanylyltransferase